MQKCASLKIQKVVHIHIKLILNFNEQTTIVQNNNPVPKFRLNEFDLAMCSSCIVQHLIQRIPHSVPWNLHWTRIIYTSLSSSCLYCLQSFWSLEASQIVTSGLLTQSSDTSNNNSLFPLIRVCVQPNQPTNQSAISKLWHHCSGSFHQHGYKTDQIVRVMRDQRCAYTSCLLHTYIIKKSLLTQMVIKGFFPKSSAMSWSWQTFSSWVLCNESS